MIIFAVAIDKSLIFFEDWTLHIWMVSPWFLGWFPLIISCTPCGLRSLIDLLSCPYCEWITLRSKMAHYRSQDSLFLKSILMPAGTLFIYFIAFQNPHLISLSLFHSKNIVVCRQISDRIIRRHALLLKHYQQLVMSNHLPERKSVFLRRLVAISFVSFSNNYCHPKVQIIL